MSQVTLFPSHRVSALFVQPDGCYATMPDVDPWPESRDARTYAGPLPVVAHPPCATWGRYHHKAGGLGNDAGCFASALDSVRKWGGVIEHPATSQAWERYGMPRPMDLPDDHGGWTIPVFQSWWGHEAIKPTWLYLVGIERVCIFPGPLPECTRPLEHMSRRQRSASPVAFARWLVELAASSRIRTAKAGG
jgi:hypothetical protein